MPTRPATLNENVGPQNRKSAREETGIGIQDDPHITGASGTKATRLPESLRHTTCVAQQMTILQRGKMGGKKTKTKKTNNDNVISKHPWKPPNEPSCSPRNSIPSCGDGGPASPYLGYSTTGKLFQDQTGSHQLIPLVDDLQKKSDKEKTLLHGAACVPRGQTHRQLP